MPWEVDALDVELRRARVWQHLAEAGGATRDACTACRAALPRLTGVSVTVMTGAFRHDRVCASDPLSARLDEAQFTAGEGPGLDVFAVGAPLLAPDLTHRCWARRWPAFAPTAVAAGVRAVYAVPLSLGEIRFGVLSGYRDEPGPLEARELAELLLFADTVTLMLIEDQRGRLPGLPDRRPLLHAAVHQATGMVAVQLGVPLETALLRLRARAFAENRPLREVAGDVVARRIRFTTDDNPGGRL